MHNDFLSASKINDDCDCDTGKRWTTTVDNTQENSTSTVNLSRITVCLSTNRQCFVTYRAYLLHQHNYKVGEAQAQVIHSVSA